LGVKRIIFPLFIFMLAGSVLASPQLVTDPAGGLYHLSLSPIVSGETSGEAVLSYARSIDSGITFSRPAVIFSFSREVEAFDFRAGLYQSYYLAFAISGEVYYTFSRDQGITFQEPELISRSGRRPALAVNDKVVTLAWEELTGEAGANINYLHSQDQGLNWSDLKKIEITGESLSQPSLVIDPFGNDHLVFLSDNEKLGLKRLYYSALKSFPPRILFEGHEPLGEPRLSLSPWGIVVFWRSDNLGRRENNLMVSLDQGTSFGKVNKIPLDAELLTIGFYGGRWAALTSDPSPAFNVLTFEPPPAPRLKFPPDRFAANIASPEIAYLVEGAEPLICKIEISWDNTFSPDKTWCFEHLSPPGSPEVHYQLPIELAEGDYFLRLSAFDGLMTSFPSDSVRFKIDRTLPAITLKSPTEEVSDQSKAPLMVVVSEPVQLTLNGVLLTPEADGRYKSEIVFQPGVNDLILLATDEAGNSGRIIKKILYTAIRPEITVTKPADTDWFKPGSTIFVQAAARDPQDDIADETEAQLTVSGIKLEDTIVYDKNSGALSGFIDLPAELPDGRLAAEIRLKDASNNTGKSLFKINIDRTPPSINHGVNEPIYSNSPNTFFIPVLDAGAGIDHNGTIIRIAGISVEGSGISSEADKLTVRSIAPLLDGTYEVVVIPRDLIGNTGEATALILVVDTKPPQLILLSSCEAEVEQPRLLIEGETGGDFPVEIKIYDNHRVLESFKPGSSHFQREIALVPGNNDILVEAFDLAGNHTARELRTFADLRSASTFFASYGNGPNPFSIKQDGQMAFTYNLSSAADLRIYIFDLTGTLVWKRELINRAAGRDNLAWNGTDHFGNTVESGVYPYLLQASYNNSTEIKRGKIIVIQ
jgi:hypothetical protein